MGLTEPPKTYALSRDECRTFVYVTGDHCHLLD